MAKYLIVNIIDDLNKRDVTRVDKIDVSLITDIFMSDKNLLVVETESHNYYIKETVSDLNVQMIQLILGRGGSATEVTLTSPNGTKFQLVVDNDGYISVEEV